MSLKIDTREVAHVSILDISGRIVLGDEIHTLRDAVRNLVKQDKKKIILNLANVDQALHCFRYQGRRVPRGQIV